jgi:hypothetical protein
LEIFAEPGRPTKEIQYLKRVGYSIKDSKPSFVSAVRIDPAEKDRPAVGVEDFASQRTKPPGNRDPHPKVMHSS